MFITKKNPSAGIGRQGKFKLFWYYIVNVRLVPWIHGFLIELYLFKMLPLFLFMYITIYYLLIKTFVYNNDIYRHKDYLLKKSIKTLITYT